MTNMFYLLSVLSLSLPFGRSPERQSGIYQRITKHLTGFTVTTTAEDTEMELDDFPAVHSEKALKLLIRNMVLEVNDSDKSNGKGKANGKNTNKSSILKNSKEGHRSASQKKKQHQKGAGASSNDTKPASESAKRNQRNYLNHGQNGG